MAKEEKEEKLENPYGWPEEKGPFPFPTEEQVEEAIRREEEAIRKDLKELEGKITKPTSEILHTIINI